MFTQATRENNIELHLLTTQELKIFFVYHDLNNVRLMLLHTASIKKLKEKSLDVWHEL